MLTVKGTLSRVVVSAGFLFVPCVTHAQESVGGIDQVQATQTDSVSSGARAIVDRFNSYYRSVNEFACSGEMALSLDGKALEDKILLESRAVRPGKVEVIAFDRIGAFPTSQFISNGDDLYEYSIRRNSYMISKMSADFDALYHRALARSAPNLPVEVMLALLSEQPMQNLMKLSVEPGLIRKVGEEVVSGISCDVLVVNDRGSRVWISSMGAPRLMRYQNSEITSRPRYLPKGAQAKGLDVVLEFRSWVDHDTDEAWDWNTPESATRMATMHESANGPGPEDGYASMDMKEASDPDQPGLESSSGRVGFRRFGTTTDRPETGLPVGSTVPEVEFHRADGTTVSLEELRGDRPAALIFWVPRDKFTQSAMGRVIATGRRFADSCAVIPVAVGGDRDRILESISKRPEFKGSFLDLTGTAERGFQIGIQPGIVLVESDGTVYRNMLGPRPRLAERLADQLKTMISTARRSPDPEATPSPSNGSEGDSPSTESDKGSESP